MRFRFLIYSLGLSLGSLAIGYGIDGFVGYGRFAEHMISVPLVLASYSPWFAVFTLQAGLWGTIVDFSFQRHNQDAAKGLAFELTQQNSAAAAIIATMPIAILAILLLAIATLTN